MRFFSLHQLLPLVAAAAAVTAAQPPLAACARDIQNVCPNARSLTIQQLYDCLQQSYDQLSQECKAALGAAVPGGCEADAQLFCSSKHTVADILACLRDHKEELSEVCTHNMEQKKPAPRPPNGFLRFEPPRITRTFALVTVLVLVVPLCVCAWAARKMMLFTRENQAFLSKCEKRALRSQIFRAQLRGDGSPGSAELATSSTEQQHEISFVYVNFWSLSRSSPLQLKRQKKQILHDISARFVPCELTAIMGPSGCGKTTLLNLIGGHSVGGEFSGVRMIDGKAHKVGRYDELIRQQGFVKQGDLLFDNLTAWETLAFAANLRLPDHLSIQQKLERAMQIIQQMGLLPVAPHVVGKPGGKGGISGGQRRRLSIALELLRLPSVLMLDEPTSGLDATASLRLVQLLHDMAKTQHRTVVTTIHQPRAEVFELFDRILLLGVGGYMIYFGSARGAIDFFRSIPSVRLNPLEYQNVGDFIIDVLGLSPDEDGQARSPIHAAHFTDTHMVTEEGVALDGSAEDAAGEETGLLSEEHIELRDLTRSVPHRMQVPLSVVLAQAYAKSDMLYELLLAEARRFARISTPNRGQSRSDLNPDLAVIPSLTGGRLMQIRQPTAFWTQLWLLFSRRFQVITPDAWDLISFYGQLTVVGCVIGIAFSYETKTDLEIPYQVFMLLFVTSSYAMIMQYLVLMPEYMQERDVLRSERAGHVVGYGPYIAAAALTEVPRGVMQALLLIGLAYAFHEMNPDPVSEAFCIVCLMVGLSAWQSVLALCAALTDELRVAYSLAFLLLGGGTLFGGLLVRVSNIPTMFKPIYYLSVTAVTQRALIVNDFSCCYLTTTCNDIAQQLHLHAQTFPNFDFSQLNNASLAACPEELQMTGDGLEEGNLGRLALQVLGLQNVSETAALLTLFLAAIGCRVLAVVVLYIREIQEYALRDVDPTTPRLKLLNLAQSAHM